MTKETLQVEFETGRHVDSRTLLEYSWVTINDLKVIGRIKDTVEEHWARKTTKEYFAEKYTVLEDNFDMVGRNALKEPGRRGQQCANSGLQNG